jgi:hypothetical protein
MKRLCDHHNHYTHFYHFRVGQIIYGCELPIRYANRYNIWYITYINYITVNYSYINEYPYKGYNYDINATGNQIVLCIGIEINYKS